MILQLLYSRINFSSNIQQRFILFFIALYYRVCGFVTRIRKYIAIMLSKIALCLDNIQTCLKYIGTKYWNSETSNNIVVDGDMANERLGIEASSTNQWFSVIHAHMWWVRRRNFGLRVDVTRNLNNKKERDVGLYED